MNTKVLMIRCVFVEVSLNVNTGQYSNIYTCINTCMRFVHRIMSIHVNTHEYPQATLTTVN